MPPTNTDAPDDALLDRACALLAAGQPIGIPTETVYGLAADARQPAAVARLFAIKARPADRPVSLLLPGAHALAHWADGLPPAAHTLAHACWPGPLTLIVRAPRTTALGFVPPPATLGLRVPDHPLTLALLQRYNAPLAAPSANPSGTLSPTTAEHVRRYFPQLPLILDGGPCTLGLESTIVDCTTTPPRILRPGALPTERIAALLHLDPAALTAVPQTPLHLGKPLRLLPLPALLAEARAHLAHRQPLAILTRTPAPADLAAHPLLHWHTAPATPEAYAHALYDTLHRLAHTPATHILVETLPDIPDWHALATRLQRFAVGD